MKKILISLLAVVLTMGLFAAQRTAEEAAAIAKQVNYSTLPMAIKKNTPALVPQRQDHSVRLVHTQLQPKSDKAAFYVFDRDQQGFVIVSADDNTRDVLAYSEEGIFPEQVPSNVQFLLNYIAERVANAGQSTSPAPLAATYTPVAPLLNGIEWDQGAPYYNNCPLDGGYRSVTGCVATATAQVMRYWKWPETGTGSHSYYCENLSSQLSANFANTTYDWANMPKTTAEYKTTAQKNAVATLMYHVGVSVDMMYSSEGSGAYTNDVATALVDYFGYKNTCEYRTTYEWNYTRGEWVTSEPAATTAQYMRAELAQGRPVIVGGTDEEGSSGHEFVFEGYDKDGLFYVNWGWSGMCNGYYAIDNLAPEELGIGAGFGEYSHFLDYIIGIEPNKTDDPSVPKEIRGLQYGQALYVEQESNFWAVDLYNDWIDNAYVYPELYFNIIAKNKTLLAGTYNLEYVEYQPTSDKVIKLKSDGVVTVSLAQDNKYRFVGSFVGTDGRTYTFDQKVLIAAYDYQTKEEITLEDKLENATIVIEDYKSADFTTTDGLFTVLGEKADALSSPIYNTDQKDLRNYAKGTFTLTYSAGNMTKIIFNLSEQGKKRQATITPSVGDMAYDVENGHVTWTGNAAQVIFTVGEKATYGSDGSSKAGQFDFVSIDLELTETPAPSGIPTVADLTAAGYNVTNSRVICIRPDEQVCNPIVWVGTYRVNEFGNWSTNVEELSTFEPLDNYPGWYVVEVNDNSATVQGKPVQLKLDGSFNWDFQSGDVDAWINMAQSGTQTAIVNPGYDGEADCTWPNKGAYIYELAYWKKHNTPCVAVPTHDYSISLYAPKFCEAIANYADSVRIMGGFDNWTMGKLMEKRVDANNQIYYYTTLPNTEENTEFKFRCGSMSWEFQIRYNGYDLANEKTGTETDLVYYYNGKGYNWAFCPEPVYLTVNSNDYSHSITMGSGTYDKDANVLIMAANTDEGYVFDQWNDGNKAAARYVTVSEDITYTAFFVPKSSETCIEVASNDETLGIAVVAVMALPINGGTFLNWDDGNTENPRVINELDGTLYTAIFTTGTPTDMQKVEGNDDQAVRKIIKDDRLYIIRNGIEYIATGARTK